MENGIERNDDEGITDLQENNAIIDLKWRQIRQNRIFILEGNIIINYNL